MDQLTFKKLVDWLFDKTGLVGTRYQTVEQKVMIFLWILAHAESQRNAAHFFQVSQSTVSEIVNNLLPKFESLHKAFVQLNHDSWLDPVVELDPKLNAFNGCIGAIDGTHIFAHIPLREQQHWRDRKGQISQNVFAAVRSDYSFSYVLAGAEGSINDSSLCQQAFGRDKFSVPPNRYFLADAGFGSREGIVVPFPGVRYHLQDWKNAVNPPETRKELYNLRHARIRVVVEQAFGLLKRRWKIVRSSAPEYGIDQQVSIVYAVTALHNFVIFGGKEFDRNMEEELDLNSQGKNRGSEGTRWPFDGFAGKRSRENSPYSGYIIVGAISTSQDKLVLDQLPLCNQDIFTFFFQRVPNHRICTLTLQLLNTAYQL